MPGVKRKKGRFPMKKSLAVLLMASSMLLLGCGAAPEENLIGRMPAGYDMYFTVHPRKAQLRQIMESIGNQVPSLSERGRGDLGFDVLSWNEWEERLGLDYGSEAGLVARFAYRESMLAIYLPTDDVAAVGEIMEQAGLEPDEYRVLEWGSYSVLAWGEREALDRFEDDMEGETLGELAEFGELRSTLDRTGLAFNLYIDSPDVPFSLCAISGDENDRSVTEIAVEIEEPGRLSELFDCLEEGIYDGRVSIPQGTGGIVRFRYSPEMLAENWSSISEELGLGRSWQLEQFEASLSMVGIPSLMELNSILGGEVFWAIRDIDVDELEHMADIDLGQVEMVFAITLRDTEEAISALENLAAMAGFESESMDGADIYETVDYNGAEYFLFVYEDALYISFNVEPELIVGGSTVSELLSETPSGVAENGFLGGYVDLDAIMAGVDLPAEAKGALERVLSQTVEGSLSYGNGIFHLTSTGGNMLGSNGIMAGIVAAIAVPKFTSVQDQAMEVSCRSNMRSLATAQAMYYGNYDRYAGSALELEEMMDNAPSLRCPACTEPYEIRSGGDSYTIQCPCGHGSVVDGICSWQ